MKPIIITFLLIFITACTTGNITKEISDDINISVYFCPRDNCGDKLFNLFNGAEKINCAFFELELENIIQLMEESSKTSNIKLVVDNNYYQNLPNLSFIRTDNRKALMHNKFCTIEKQNKKFITTGSHNPTQRGTFENNNNLLIIESNYLHQNYQEEFNEFWNSIFGKGDKVKYNYIRYNNNSIENYFCPEDNCEDHVSFYLERAENNIKFMIFSFTSDKLGDLIINKSNNIEVKGIFESFQAGSQYSEYQKMKDILDVKKDNNPAFLHHKVFIIDDSITILGSYNPTGSGDRSNDENLLIIYDKEVADRFLEEFDYVWNL
ncbi:MAG: hypothetical protein ISS82_03100 [Nanoarchaeota archaeon]|nr:hypothetical protein [Nanoarchaeota archaeon]